ncbi:hypothetical protein J2Z69_003204 [Paenibacillus shirakamiensis]|uniref:Uncharacterized protein n=1 Tax=Paenibacillus shirakamiensis TaxID=1265935 RepID=A0ABS4JKA8_9BACL|nr:hypothetical protein [Paenibacillus shirakamiensis]
MAYYVFTLHRNILPYGKVHMIDLVVANSGTEPFEVYIEGEQDRRVAFKFLYHLGAVDSEFGRRSIQDISVNEELLNLKIITNRLLPYHCEIRLYFRDTEGTTLGVISEHQMHKLCN